MQAASASEARALLRVWQRAGLAALLMLLAAAPLRAARGRYRVVEVKPHVFIWVPDDILDFDGDPRFSLPGTAGFIVTNEGVVVINTTNSPFHARELLYEIRQRTAQPVKYVINTDARGDHMLGNEVFVDQRAEILASAAAASAMQQYHDELLQRMNAEGERAFDLRDRMRGIHFTLPSRTFSGSLTLRVGGQDVRLERLGAGPSPGDLVVYLPGAHVLFLGDLYENGYIPRLAPNGLSSWAGIVRRVEGWDADVYVPGQGAPGGKQDLAQFLGFLEWVAQDLRYPSSNVKSLLRVHDGQPLRAIRHEDSPSQVPAQP